MIAIVDKETGLVVNIGTGKKPKNDDNFDYYEDATASIGDSYVNGVLVKKEPDPVELVVIEPSETEILLKALEKKAKLTQEEKDAAKAELMQ